MSIKRITASLLLVAAIYALAQRDDLAADNAVLSGKAHAAEEMLLYLLEGGEPDWDGWLGKHDGLCDYFRERLTATVPQLEGDLKGARKSRDHWRNVASRHGGKIRRLKHELHQARKYGDIWPRFEDGACVEFGDCGLDVHGKQREAYCFKFYGSGLTFIEDSSGNAWWGNDSGPSEDPDVSPDKRVERPPLAAKNGKPEWLAHEQPDSWERIKDDATIAPGVYCDKHGISNPEPDMPLLVQELWAKDLIRRCEKLAKEGA